MPGMCIAETLTNRLTAVIVNEGTVLDERIIEKLKYFGYQKIRVYIESDLAIEQRTIEAVKSEYSENLLAMKGVLLDISDGKSLDMPTVMNVSNMMYKRHRNIVGVLACLNQVRESDEYTHSHSLNVAYICLFIAKWMKLNSDILIEVLEAGLLHDVGKCLIPSEILNKPAVLNEQEFAEIKKHPVYGYQILSAESDVKPSTALAALTHHEKMNGKGYPLGVMDNKIHPYGKIVAVADIYDAMTSNRVYHSKSSPFQVFSILEDLAYSSLDPEIVMSFISTLSGYYVGDRVLLSDGRYGRLVFINPRSISRPIVQTENAIINLADIANKELFISEII